MFSIESYHYIFRREILVLKIYFMVFYKYKTDFIIFKILDLD